MRRLLEATPRDGQRLLFSATLDGAVDVLARRFLTWPALHAVDTASPPARITHHQAIGRGAAAASAGFRSRRGRHR